MRPPLCDEYVIDALKNIIQRRVCIHHQIVRGDPYPLEDAGFLSFIKIKSRWAHRLFNFGCVKKRKLNAVSFFSQQVKGLADQTWLQSPEPTAEGNNFLLQVVFWPLHRQHGMRAPVLSHVTPHTQITMMLIEKNRYTHFKEREVESRQA